MSGDVEILTPPDPADDLPLTAVGRILEIRDVQFQACPDSNGEIVSQSLIVTSPYAEVHVLEAHPTGHPETPFSARVALIEPAIMAPSGEWVPKGHLLELKAQHEAKTTKQLPKPKGGLPR